MQNYSGNNVAAIKRRLASIRRCLLVLAMTCCAAMAQAAASTKNNADPLLQITGTFSKTIEFKNKGRLLEFCPDNTCHGFVALEGVPHTDLRDFAFLYIYFFSDYIYLDEWRAHDGPKATAALLLSKSEYRDCKNENSRQAARCVLLNLSRKGRIKLIFIRYDEGQRNVVHENIAEQLSEKEPPPKQ